MSLMTNILKPELLWIEGRCYRVTDQTAEVCTFQEHDLYGNEVTFKDTEDEEDMDEIEVTMINEDRFSGSLHVSKHYLGHIIGKKGAVRARVERDTNTQVKIPRQGHAGDVVVHGSTAANVKAALRKINMIVMSSRMRQKSTHFIAIPMNSQEIIKSFESFKESVLRDCPSRGIEESVFIKPTKLHITSGVMCLMDNEERMLASKLLEDAKCKVIMPLLQEHLPLKLRLKGLSYMNDDPTQINVLYGCVEEVGAPTGLVQNLADSLVDHFYKAGLMNNMEHGREHVKIHVTLMNSKYRETSSAQDDELEPRRRTETFDGSAVLEKFANYDFGVAEITDIHLSQRRSMGADGFYKPTCVISFK